MPRPRKPTAQKKLEGTWRKDRDANAVDVRIEGVRGVIIPDGTSLPCPPVIRTDYVKSFWNHLTSSLQSMHVLGWADLPDIEGLCVTLEKLREARKLLSSCTPDDEKYERYLKAVSRLTAMWQQSAQRYFISPAARQKMVLDGLNIEKTAQEIGRAKSPVESVLDLRGGN